MRKNLLLSMLFTLTTMSLYAQAVVKGRVTSADDGSGIPGVSVSIKGTSKGTQTDVEGNYSISASSSATLEFSFVGFKSTSVAVGNQSTINVALESDVKTLSEVVVTGFGSQIKRELTGNIAQVKGKDIENMPTASVDAALQGKAGRVN